MERLQRQHLRGSVLHSTRGRLPGRDSGVRGRDCPRPPLGSLSLQPSLPVSTCLPTEYLLTVPTCPPTFPPVLLPICLPTGPLAFPPIWVPAHLYGYLPTYMGTCPPTQYMGTFPPIWVHCSCTCPHIWYRYLPIKLVPVPSHRSCTYLPTDLVIAHRSFTCSPIWVHANRSDTCSPIYPSSWTPSCPSPCRFTYSPTSSPSWSTVSPTYASIRPYPYPTPCPPICLPVSNWTTVLPTCDLAAPLLAVLPATCLSLSAHLTDLLSHLPAHLHALLLLTLLPAHLRSFLPAGLPAQLLAHRCAHLPDQTTYLPFCLPTWPTCPTYMSTDWPTYLPICLLF